MVKCNLKKIVENYYVKTQKTHLLLTKKKIFSLKEKPSKRYIFYLQTKIKIFGNFQKISVHKNSILRDFEPVKMRFYQFNQNILHRERPTKKV